MLAKWQKGKGDLSDVYRCYSCSTSLKKSRIEQVNEVKQDNGFEDDKSGYFTNIVRELAAEDTPAYHQMMRMKFYDFTAILREIVADITPSSPKRRA